MGGRSFPPSMSLTDSVCRPPPALKYPGHLRPGVGRVSPNVWPGQVSSCLPLRLPTGVCLSLVAVCPSPGFRALPSSGSLGVGGEERQVLLPRATTAGPDCEAQCTLGPVVWACGSAVLAWRLRTFFPGMLREMGRGAAASRGREMPTARSLGLVGVGESANSSIKPPKVGGHWLSSRFQESAVPQDRG